MQIRPFLTKIRLKFRAWLNRLRPPIAPLLVGLFFKKHWRGVAPSANYFCTVKPGRFYFDVNSSEAYVKQLESRFANCLGDLIVSAWKITENHFELLGFGETDLGEKINWHLDFNSGFEWPKSPYSKIKLVDLSNHADIKIPWELSRLQFLTTLGRAFWITKERKFKDHFVAILTDWLKNNPVDHGVNWACSMEVAIRAINIIWSMNFFGGRGVLSDELIREIIRSLYYHALHIEKNLEYIDKDSNTNHLLVDYLGLFYVGLFFPEFDKSEKWLKMGKNGLETEIQLQVLEGGADYECSLSYHRMVLEIFLSAFILGRANEVTFADFFVSRLVDMVEFSSAMTAQSGKVPAIGDNDDGYIVKFANIDSHDHRALLDVAAQVLGVKIPVNVELSEERLWYLGPDSLSRWPAMTHRRPRLFKKSGYAVIQNEDMHLVLNACGITEKAFGGHKHNDLLSLSLEINSVPFLIDAGTACYTSNFHLRNQSRSTFVHNTIAVNKAEQSRFLEKALFFMFRDAHPCIDLWTVTDDVVLVSGFHDGYNRHGGGIIHRRILEVSLKDKTIDICDEISGDSQKEHVIECNYLTPWKCHKSKNLSETRIEAENGQSLRLTFEGPIDMQLKLASCDYYPHYGLISVGTQINCQCRSKLPFKMRTHLNYQTFPIKDHAISKFQLETAL